MNKKSSIVFLSILASAVSCVAGCGRQVVVVPATTEQTEITSSEDTESLTVQAAYPTAAAGGSLNKKDSETLETTTAAVDNKGEYFFYDSDKRLLTEADLDGMSAEELRLARNEIFARRGRIFREKELQDYFGSKSWYKPSIDPDDFNANAEKYLNDTEIKNVQFIKSVEDRKKKDEYFFYDSDDRLLTETDLEGMSAEDLRLARNEIFARKGRKFKEKELQDYFNSKSWYKPAIDPDDFNANADRYLNDIEKKNVALIKSVEDKINSSSENEDKDDLEYPSEKLHIPEWFELQKVVVKDNVLCFGRKEGIVWDNREYKSDSVRVFAFDGSGKLVSDIEYIFMDTEERAKRHAQSLRDYSKDGSKNSFGMTEGQADFYYSGNILIEVFSDEHNRGKTFDSIVDDYKGYNWEIKYL